MIATTWEFKERGLVFGLIFGVAFCLYFVDHQTSTVLLADWLAPRLHASGDLIARLLFAFAALLLVVAALMRTWASSYLHAGVVYASQVKTDSLVADGPYRYVRNPLYLANILLAVGLGAMMSRSGFVVGVAAMAIFCYRLIFREEAELRGSQGQPYESYTKTVPRMFPSPRPRVAPSGRLANWSAGFKAEAWSWGFAAGTAAFAITLKIAFFFAILAVSIALFWVSSTVLEKKSRSQL